jgi:hypothetical protein
VLVITAAHSRFVTGQMIPTRKTEDLLLGTWELIQQLGRVPRRSIWDNEPGIGRGQRRAEGVAAFMGTLATKLVLLPPRDLESKGIVKRRNGWFETSFMPGRSFRSPADFNTQFTEWLGKANARVVRTIGDAPVQRLDADRAAMLPLPPIPLHLGWRNRIRLDTNDYSVDPAVIGRLVDVTADLERVRVRANGRVVADHRRVWARGTTVTDPSVYSIVVHASASIAAIAGRAIRGREPIGGARSAAYIRWLVWPCEVAIRIPPLGVGLRRCVVAPAARCCRGARGRRGG